MAEPNPKVLIVDGMALLFRAYYAQSYSARLVKGVPTNAIFGFLHYLFDAIHTFEPSHVVCCWDMGSKTFRTELYDGYKQNRGEPPLELIPQFDLVKEVVADMGVTNIGIAGFEADDCIGTLAKQLSTQAEVYILTGDHDMLQLVSETIKVVIMKKGKLNYAVYDPDFLFAERQLTPLQVIDLKGFMGDTSDNYPGVKGIGEKTALKLIVDYESVEGVLANLDKLPKGVRGKIEADLDMLHLSRDLARIRLDAPVTCKLDDCLWNVRLEPAKKRFMDLEFGSLVKLLEKHAKAEGDADLFAEPEVQTLF
ncbi:5'-3' exonuclease H3TH domain-containing protein [Gorillibacterium massiliense]|uniref:5'-3' exonuclease n=1 Tax=Gorillibacterium massiliense TaxID=1280390 RepID=UPI0012DDA00B